MQIHRDRKQISGFKDWEKGEMRSDANGYGISLGGDEIV